MRTVLQSGAATRCNTCVQACVVELEAVTALERACVQHLQNTAVYQIFHDALVEFASLVCKHFYYFYW
jgi:hypothetical protein